MWAWVALWAVLLVGAAVVLGLLALSLWGKSRALLREASAASRQLSAIRASATGNVTDRPRSYP
ncbi:hypothetical protein [Motilibacter aurantiacus]|uniref:hypothetical protein n=1 Tax=Motilibacter aurantiacus TaxID=2714955 RepID=UPI00140DFC60|nr:hypothetical protein [Motilibacter aurantiacus]NHC47329.1 hypothetical protein [Motilibacter aurantiacus]